MKALLVVAVAAVAAVAACDARAHVATCADDLAGEWASDDGKHWGLVEAGGHVEGYPLFVDHPPGRTAGVTTAPRALDLHRTDTGLAGTIARRYQLAAHACVATAEVHVVGCAADTLELVIAEPSEPVFVDDDHCTAIRPDSSGRVRWRRVP